MNIPESIQEAIISFLEGELNQSQADELIAWLEKDNNVQYFRQVEDIWAASSNLETAEHDVKKGLNKVRKKIVDRDIRSLPSKEIRFSIPALLGIAATVLILITLSVSRIFFFSHNQKGVEINHAMVEATAPRGSRSLIILSDSTTIWLNSDTRLRYPIDYGFTNRTVYLEGEAFFKVSPNADLPFQVNTSEIKVIALGTAFNVKAYRDEGTIETTLEEGQVSIDLLDPGKKKRSVEAVILRPKQTAVYQKQEGTVNFREQKINDKITNKPVKANIKDILPVKVSEVSDTKLYTSWKDTRWIFRNEKFSSLSPKLERRYNVKIQLVDKTLEEYTFTGTILEESLEQVLAAIQMTSPIRYEINSQEVKLYEDKFLQEQYKKLIRNY